MLEGPLTSSQRRPVVEPLNSHVRVADRLDLCLKVCICTFHQATQVCQLFGEHRQLCPGRLFLADHPSVSGIILQALDLFHAVRVLR